MTEDEKVGWYQQLDGHEFEQVLGVDDGQRSLASCCPWCHKVSDLTEQLNCTELMISVEHLFTCLVTTVMSS